MRLPPLRVLFYLATATAIVAGGATLIGRGVPRLATAAFILGYIGLIALGVLSPNTGIFGDAITRVPSGIALTFDDGPDPVHTPRILEILAAHGAHATFFLIGRKMEAHPEVVRDIVARGHAVGAHGYSHDRLYALRTPAWLRRDADREESAWKSVLNAAPVLFRPPIGLTNPRIAALVDARDRLLVGWTVRPRDGLAKTTAEQVISRVVPKLRKGAIVLLHDAPEQGDRTPAVIEALPAILDAAARLGLSARTVPES